MNVLMSYWNLSDFYYYRYRNQFKAIADQVDNLYILYMNGHRVDYEDNITYIKLKRKYALEFWKRRLKFPLITYYKTMKMIKHIPRFDYDVFYMMSGGAVNQYMSYLIAKKLDLPLVVRIRGDGKAEREVFVKSWIRRKAYNYYDNKVLKNADLLIPISTNFGDVLYKRNYEKISKVIKIGVDTDDFNYSELPEKLTVGYFGRISKEKGSEFLLELMNKTPDINYVVAGAKYYKIDFPENCEYYGVMKHSKMSELYDQCSIVLMPSYIKEGISNTILESYAKGRTILASPNAIPYEIKPFGWIERLDVNKWIDILNNLINKQEKFDLKGIGLRAREWVKKYSWNQFGEDIVNEMKTVVRTKTSWSKEGKVDYLDRIWQEPDEIPEYRRMMIDQISKFLNIHREWKLLDAGCGTGLLFQYLPLMFQNNYYGIDYTPEMIELCHTKYPEIKDRFKQANIIYADQIPKKANIIITQNVIQHNDLWQIAMMNLINRAKDVVIFCERTHDEHTVKVSDDPPRWRFNIDDFKDAMEFFGKGVWDRPEIIGKPKSTEGLEHALTIYLMRKRK